jgi:hypothetical protein
MEGFPFAIKFFHADRRLFKLPRGGPMRGRKVVPSVILILFLISVAVLEVILRHEDRGEQGDSTHGRESAKSSKSSLDSSGSLKSLARAVQHETAPPAIESPARTEDTTKEDNTREYNREDARSK